MVMMVQIMCMMCIIVLGVMDQFYVEIVFLKGLCNGCVVLCYVMFNVVVFIVNVVLFNIVYLIIGVVLVEVVFNYNGLGCFMVDVVLKCDLLMVQVLVMIFGVVYVFLNMVVDIVVIVFNLCLCYLCGKEV